MLVRLKRLSGPGWMAVESELKKEAGLGYWRDLSSNLVPYPVSPSRPSTHVSSSTHCHATRCIFTY